MPANRELRRARAVSARVAMPTVPPASAPVASPARLGATERFSRFARVVAMVVAHPVAFVLAVVSVVVWAASGPFYKYSETWQLVINTGTTILTFLMVFVLQNTQNRDSRAVQIKLDELLRALRGARNELIDVENLSEEELTRYCREFQELHLRYARTLGGKNTGGTQAETKLKVTTEIKKDT